MSVKRRIVAIGWGLIGLLLASIFFIAITSIIEGTGAQSWKIARAGKGGQLFPITLLPVFLAAIIIAGLWLRRHFLSPGRDPKRGNKE